MEKGELKRETKGKEGMRKGIQRERLVERGKKES